MTSRHAFPALFIIGDEVSPMIDTGHGRRKSPSPKMRTEASDDPLSADMPGIGTSHTVTERNSACEAGMHASEGGRSDEPLTVSAYN